MAGTSSRASLALTRRALADSRTRTLSFALLFGLIAYANVVGYRDSYTTVRERLEFARSFGENNAIRLFYGIPHDLLTVSGYTAWRVGGLLSIFAALWGSLAAVRALRTEEESGRQELVLAGALTRRTALYAAFAAIAVGLVILWAGAFLGLLADSLPVGGSAYLALAIVSPAAVFVGIGALASQLAPTKRLALELGNGALAVALALRVVADTSASLAWLRWVTPLGWAEELRAFTGPRPLVLLAPLCATTLLLIAVQRIALRRDVGSGLLSPADSAPPRMTLLSSPTAYALRAERSTLVAWLVGTGFFAVIVGLLSTSFNTRNISPNLLHQLRKLGGASIVTPAGALGFYFLFFVLIVALFACSQIAAARREEAEERLETLLAQPVDRRGWLLGRLALAVGGGAALALAAGVLTWAGAASQHAGVPLARMLEAALNCMPAGLLFLALGALAFALLPRAAAGIAYGAVCVAFVWELFGSLLSAPTWLLELSPFHHVGLVPAQPLQVGDALVMVAIALALGLAAVWAFARRDLLGA
jgi:ABC-2 type transport system permease protein